MPPVYVNVTSFALKRSSVAGARPGQDGLPPLADGEPFVNDTDGIFLVGMPGAPLGYITYTTPPATRESLDLENVNNTADTAKPVSTPQALALAGKLDTTGDGSAVTIKRTGGSRLRSAAERAADTLNPLDFLQLGDDIAAILAGTADVAPACKAARDSRPSGAALCLTLPAGTYRLDSDVTGNGRTVTVDLLSGARVGANYGGLGVGVLYVQTVKSKVGESDRTDVQGVGSSLAALAIGPQLSIVNNGAGNAAFGTTFIYKNLGTASGNANGGDIGRQFICHWPNLTGAGFSGTWEIAISPTVSDADGPTKPFSMGTRELHAINNGPNTGFSEFDARSAVAGVGVPANFTGAYLFVPDIWQPTGGIGGHVNYGAAFLGSRELNNRTVRFAPKFYAPLLIGGDSIAPGGTGLFIGGKSPLAVDSDAVPLAPLRVKYAFAQGFDTTGATFNNGQAWTFGVGQALAWTTAGGTVSLNTDTTGKLTIAAPGGLVLPSIAWTAFTATISPYTGAIASYTALGRWQRTGRRIDFMLTITFTNGGTGGGGLNVFGLPVAAVASEGTAFGRENAATNKSVNARIIGTGMLVNFYDGTYVGATGNVVVISGFYEAAA